MWAILTGQAYDISTKNLFNICLFFQKVAAIEDSFEYRLGIRRNAKMNTTGKFCAVFVFLIFQFFSIVKVHFTLTLFHMGSFQAITGENFSQSEYVAFGAISQFVFPQLAKAIHRAFDYVNLSNLCSKQAFHSINLSNVGFIIESQSVRINVRIHISFRQKPIIN